MIFDFSQTAFNNLIFPHDRPIFLGRPDFLSSEGKKHYRLLALISKQLASYIESPRILELGTDKGASAYCLGYDSTITVHTYDTKDIRIGDLHLPNILFFQGGLFPVHQNEDRLNSYIHGFDLIFVNAEPHNGILENILIEWILKNDYRGYILFDNIHLNPRMEEIWAMIPEDKKLDITDKGRWSGTGLWIRE